jgi:hypothetical protein
VGITRTAPLGGGFGRLTQQCRDVARLGLAQVRIDALLGQRLFIVLDVLGNTGIEHANADIEQLGLGNVDDRLLGLDFRNGLGLAGDAPGERQRRREDACRK